MMVSLDKPGVAKLAGLSVPTFQRMEASAGVVRGNVDSLTRLVAALDKAGLELIAENAASLGSGRGVRLKSAKPMPLVARNKTTRAGR